MKPKDLMGKIIIPIKELVRKSDGNYCYWHPIEIPTHRRRAGWVVGARSIQNGNCEFIGEEEGYSFEQLIRIPCILVAYWPTTKPIKVPLDAWVFAEGLKPYPPNGSPNDKESMKRFYAKCGGWPRDEKGRFV